MGRSHRTSSPHNCKARSKTTIRLSAVGTVKQTLHIVGKSPTAAYGKTNSIIPDRFPDAKFGEAEDTRYVRTWSRAQGRAPSQLPKAHWRLHHARPWPSQCPSPLAMAAVRPATARIMLAHAHREARRWGRGPYSSSVTGASSGRTCASSSFDGTCRCSAPPRHRGPASMCCSSTSPSRRMSMAFVVRGSGRWGAAAP